jgi:hypothetical protein
MADQASATAGGTQGTTTQLSQDIELQGIVANGVLGGLPVAERNQDFFLIFRNIGGTGPEIIDQTAYFIEYLVDSEGNIFKPSENTSALHNLLQNFQINKPVNVVVDKASVSNTTMGGQHQLTAVGVQQPILYSQTGSSAGAFTGSIFFKGDPTLGTIGNPGGLVVPNMQAVMIKTSSFVGGTMTNFSNFVGGIPGNTDSDARSASLAEGKYFISSSRFADLQNFKLNVLIKIRNITSNDPIGFNFNISHNSGAGSQGTFNGSTEEFLIPYSLGYTVINKSYTISSPWTDSNTYGSIIDNTSRAELVIFGGSGAGTNFANLDIDFIVFGVQADEQNPQANGGLLQSAGANTPPFWLTGSGGSKYITASDYISVNYNNIQVSTGSVEIGSDTVEIGSQFKDFHLSKIQVPFKVGIGDRIRFLYNPQTDFHIYDVKEPSTELDGRLKLKLNTNLSQSLTETQLSNFVLHRTNKTIPRYLILNVVKEAGVDTANNPFTGIILPQFPTEKLLNNLDSILNKLKVEGIIEN